MTKNSFSGIDDLLGSWAVAHQPSQQHLDQLSVQVDRSLVACQAETEPVDLGRRARWYSSASFILVAAAVVTLVVSTASWVAWRGGKPRDGGRRGINPGGQIAAAIETDPIDKISTKQRLQKQRLLAELDRMFAGKRVWFAETESDVVLGGDVKPAASSNADGTSVAMRLVLAKRSSASGQWQRVWSADVVSRSDQVVQFKSYDPEQPAASCTAWTHVLPDGLVACDVDLRWENGKSGRLSDSLLLSPDETQSGASLNVGGVQYQLFHTVSLLAGIKT
jgi:hypothetical protein